MSMKEWIDMDIDQLELLDVSDIEKARVKQHVFKKRNKAPMWRKIVAASVIFLGASTATGIAFPSLASQMPFMNHVIQYFNDEEQRYENFEAFSTEVGLAQTSNGLTVMIDNAVYDGTNVTVSFAIETEHDFGNEMHISAPNWFNVTGATGSGGSNRITKISDTRYVGLSTFTPHYKDGNYPKTIEVAWSPKAFYSISNDLEIEGDWSFDFSLDRIDGDLQLINETVENEDVKFTLKSVEFTDVSTVIAYEQVVSDELLKQWPAVTPVFRVTDDLGNVYMNETGGGGKTTDDYKTFEGTTAFGSIHEDANQLIIQPVEIGSLMYGQGHTEIELAPIIIELKQ